MYLILTRSDLGEAHRNLALTEIQPTHVQANRESIYMADVVLIVDRTQFRIFKTRHLHMKDMVGPIKHLGAMVGTLAMIEP